MSKNNLTINSDNNNNKTETKESSDNFIKDNSEILKNNIKNKIQDWKKSEHNIIRFSKVLNNNPDYSSPELEGLNTLEKIIKLQEDLKIVSSIKKQFEGNQKRMLEKMDKFCFEYYKNKIGMKRIFDYCSNNDAQKNFEYKLLTTEQTKQILKNDIYNDIFNFIFLLRNENNLMLKMIDNLDTEAYEDIGEFLVNFCYEDTINISFIQEDLLIIIYLLIEKCIMKTFPESKEIKSLNNMNIYEEYFKKNILYYIFLSLTRKADIRNYLCSVLYDIIIEIENLRNSLSVEIGDIAQNLDNKRIQRKKIIVRNSTFRPSFESKESRILNNLSRLSTFQDNISLPKNSTFNQNLIPRLSLQNPNISEILLENYDKNPNNEELKANLAKSLINKDLFHSNLQNYINSKLSENEPNKSEEKEKKGNYDTDEFFNNTDTTLEYIKSTLKEYEETNKNDIFNYYNYSSKTIIAMKDYLNHLIDDMNSEEIQIEKYSNMILVNSLIASKTLKSIDYYNKIIDFIKNNYQNIIEIIRELFNTIKDNINSLPPSIKIISNDIDILLNHRYKNNLSLYTKYMIKANFLLGNIILPVFENPNYNGIITNEIITNITKDNIKIITSIIKMMLTGNLFTIGVDPCMTIFNQFIIGILPLVFEIVQNIEQDLKIPESIKRLTETINDIDNEKRSINFNYFSENLDEKFYYQSICFSETNIRNILNSLIKYKNKFDEKKEKETSKEKTNEEIKKNEIIEKSLKYENFFILLFNKGDKIKNNYKEYIYMPKIIFLPSLENKINSILKDNFIGINSPIKENFKEEEISRFKKCLSEVLTYVNLIHKEYIPKCIYVKEDNYVHDNNLINLLRKNKKKMKYDNIIDKGTNSIDSDDGDNDDDPNFKTEILPKILLNVKSELGLITSDDFYQRMLYCCSYLQLHIDLLPLEYILNNYKLLFVEIIKDTESNIHILRNNILNQLNIKIKGSEKTNMIISNTYQQIKNMEKLKCIQYLYSKIEIPTKLKIIYDFNGIKNVIYEEESKKKQQLHSLSDEIPDYRKYEKDVKDIIELEEKSNMAEVLKVYFQNLKNLIRKENIIKRFSKEETESIYYELENYLLISLYDKLFPLNQTKDDIKFYNKCCRLNFIRPENIIEDKNIVNENLWNTATDYINEMDNKYTPVDKIKSFAKTFSILQNSITFCTGKNELGIDDTTKPLIYIFLKSKPKYLFSNYNYSQLYLDPELSKKQYGFFLTQINMVMNIIKDMKHTDLINVTEEQFGKDDE